MKILYIFVDNYFGNLDLPEAFRKIRRSGKETEVVRYPFEIPGTWHDPAEEERLRTAIRKEGADAVFSFNYYPYVSEVCQAEGVRYLAWIYDSPLVNLYSCTLINSCNAVFLFDSAVYEEFASQGIPTVHYLPLAASPARLGRLVPDAKAHARYDAAVSFVGALYTEKEKHTLYDRMAPKLDDHTRGYLEGVMRAQMQVQGADFVEDCLTPEVADLMDRALPLRAHGDGVETIPWLFANYVVDRKITSIERTELLRAVGEMVGGMRTGPFGNDETAAADNEEMFRRIGADSAPAENHGGETVEEGIGTDVRKPGRTGTAEMTYREQEPSLHVYTPDRNFEGTGIRNLGQVNYAEEMPLVFKCSDINLNITLRSIHKGIPLRCFDIMGCGGFLLSNYQEDLLRFFEPGKDFVYYESRADLLHKIRYYLGHPDERMRIAENGFRKVAAEHTFDIRAEQMLDMAGM